MTLKDSGHYKPKIRCSMRSGIAEVQVRNDRNEGYVVRTRTSSLPVGLSRFIVVVYEWLLMWPAM